MNGVEGFMYPNEVELQWSLLILLYPYITWLVAGAFILASLERVFKVEAVRPTYRLALLTALAFLLVAPLPLQLHLGHPERSFEMYLTPPAPQPWPCSVSCTCGTSGWCYWSKSGSSTTPISCASRKRVAASSGGSTGR